MMHASPRQLIARKRDGQTLSSDEIQSFVEQVVRETLSGAQVGAMLMAMFLRGLSREEQVALTRAMRDSGARFDLGGVSRPSVDKHSTGGVGDKASLVIAPLAAACGLAVPMISGRGLGHTGGTLDKLDSIPGYRTQLSADEIARTVAEIGAVIVGQTADLVPADRRLYAIRDVTGTVESIPLIVASILSKKLAEDLDGLVLDVKYGAGAFFPDRDRSRELAVALASVAHELGCPTVAVLSAMDQPLGRAVGNAVEVAEAIDCLRGHGPEDLEELSVVLAAEMLSVGKGTAPEAARESVRTALHDGSALEVFRRMVEAQGGDPRVIDEPQRLPQARHVETVDWIAGGSGWVAQVDARLVAEAANLLGAGRRREDDAVDPAVGVSELIKVGAPIAVGTPLGRLHVNDDSHLPRAQEMLRQAIRVSPEAIEQPPLISEIIHSHAL